MLWKLWEVRLVPGGRKHYTLCYTCPHTCTQVHICTQTCMRLHTQAAQLGLNGVSLLTYFFSVTQTQTLGTLTLNINSAIKLFALCECLGSWGGFNPTVPPIFPVVRRQQQKEAPFCRLEVLTASYSLKQPSCLRMRVKMRSRKMSGESVCVSLLLSSHRCFLNFQLSKNVIIFGIFNSVLWSSYDNERSFFIAACGQLTASPFRWLSTKYDLDMLSLLPGLINYF